MNLFLLSNYLVSLTSLVLILLLAFYGKTKIHRIWAFCNIAIFCWGVGTILFSSTSQIGIAAIGWRIGFAGGIFIATFYYHTVYILVSDKTNLKNKRFLIAAYIFAILAASTTLIAGNLVMPNFKLMFGSIYYPSASLVYSIIFFGWGVTIYAASYTLYKLIKLTKGIECIQAKYLLFAFVIGFIGGGTVHMPSWGISIYPLGNFGVALYAIIGTYAILRHQLMDIDVVIKKSLVFAGMFAFIFMAFTLVALFVARIFGGANDLVSFAVTALIIAFFMRPVETWLVNVTNKFLFQKKFGYKEIIKSFIDEIATVLDQDEVVNSTLKILDENIHPYAASIFLINKIEDKYQLYNAFGLDNKEITFTSESKMVVFMRQSHNPAVIKQVNGLAGANPKVATEMAQLKAVLVLPLLLHNELIGFIALGRKRSDEEYSKDDLDVLSDLARTETIAIANSRLLQEAAQSERRAAIGTMAAGINHEIGNPLNIINTKIQLFLTGVKRGFYQDKSKEEIVKECENILNETISQTNRISDITRRLSNFAKPSKEFKPVLLNIQQEIDEALFMVGHELELERIKIQKEIKSDQLKILGDRHELQQILFNIIRNAGQAIEETGTITIRVFQNSENKIRIEVQDTGKGISEDKQHRVFEPFFTTKGIRGTGLGLSIVRQLVWRNKGEISFSSQAGAGTTFILEFPKGE